MSDYFKAFISTFFIFETLGLVFLGLVWSVLGLLHASNIIVITGEAIAALVLLTLSVPVYRIVLRSERENSRQMATPETPPSDA